MVDESQVISRYIAAGQEHIVRHLDTLSTDAKETFLKQLDSIKVEEISSFLESALADQKEDGKVTPFSKDVGRLTDNKDKSTLAYQQGIEAISHGEVAALVLAGGQGTRLGFAGPKGMYDIGLPSGRTLFQLLAERLKRLQQVASNSIDDSATPQLKNACSCPFYIMTSPINHEQTVNFFKEKDYFGLSEDDVSFFQQGMLPCMTNEGKMIMETASEIAMAPDG
jgi:UDP-N-acetylglucosamine/UDP-N-acetylgalactosamine diphosphorylase